MEEIIKKLNEYTGVEYRFETGVYDGYMVWNYKRNNLTLKNTKIFWLDINNKNIMITRGEGKSIRLQLL